MRWWLSSSLLLALWLPVLAQEEAPVGEIPTKEEALKADGEEEAKSAEGSDQALEEEDEILEWPALPIWNDEDLERLRSGEIVPGRDLLKEFTGELILPPEPKEPEEELPPEPVVEETPIVVDPTVIEQQYLEAYFGQTPASYLIDPQEMLARQEYRDRESFLEYHAGDSEVNLYVYLFDAEQQLPAGITIESIFDKHFARSGPSALVFYFLGRPERSQIMLSREIQEVVSLDQRDKALQTSIQEAYEKTDAAHQLENFSVELSIRLYWFEKAMHAAGFSEPDLDAVGPTSAAMPIITLPDTENKTLILLTRVLWGVIIFALLAICIAVGRIVARRRLRYVFPEVEIEPLLSAPHAAGVGAVVSFSSAQLPPSQQRDQVPDYLQKM